jgi:tetratricopeptide (TPR) repeat protein
MLTIKNRLRNRSSSNLFNPFNPFSSFFLFLLLLAAGCTPAGPKALIQGEKLIDKRKYTQAIEKLKLATTLIPTNAQAWNYLGLAFHHAGQFDEAEKTYRRALLINHDLSEAHYNLGCLYLEQKKNDAAKTEFIAYTLRRANSLEALLKLGTAQLRVNELAAAEKTFQDALRLSPQNPEALDGLGCVRAHQRGRANEAVGYFRAALKAQANYPPALLNCAIVAQQQSQDKRFALQKYREYISLKPPPENVQAVKAVAFQLEQELNAPHPSSPPVQITTNFVYQRPAPTNDNHAVAAQKSDPPVNTVRPPATPTSKLATNNTRPPPAVAQPLPSNADIVKLSPEPAVKPAQDTSPPSAPATQSSAAGNDSTDIASALSANRIQAERLFAEGRRAQQAHRLTDAINSYRAATQQDPTYYDAHYNLALVNTEAANLPSAIAAYDSALAIRPDSLDARYNLALVLKQNNDYARAAGEFEKLLEKYPNDSRSHLALGNLYAQQLHEPAKARQHYLKVLETDPRNPQASTIRFWLTSNP